MLHGAGRAALAIMSRRDLCRPVPAPSGRLLALDGPGSWPPRPGPCWKNGRLQADAWAWSTRGRWPTLDRSARAGGPGAARGGLDVTSARGGTPALRPGLGGCAGRWRKSPHSSVVEVSAQVGGCVAARQVKPQEFRWTPGALGFGLTTRTRARGSRLPVPRQLFPARPHVPSGSLTKSRSSRQWAGPVGPGPVAPAGGGDRQKHGCR